MQIISFLIYSNEYTDHKNILALPFSKLGFGNTWGISDNLYDVVKNTTYLVSRVSYAIIWNRNWDCSVFKTHKNDHKMQWQ